MAYALAPCSAFLADETACASKIREPFCRDPISLLAGWAPSMRESKPNRHRCGCLLSQNPAGFEWSAVCRCCWKCSITPGCKFWSYGSCNTSTNRDQGKCWLKWGSGTQQSQQCRTSGSIAAVQFTQLPPAPPAAPAPAQPVTTASLPAPAATTALGSPTGVPTTKPPTTNKPSFAPSHTPTAQPAAVPRVTR